MNKISSQFKTIAIFAVLSLTIPFGVYLATQNTRPTSLTSRAGLSGKSFLYIWPAKSTITQCLPQNNPEDCPKNKFIVVLNTNQEIAGGVDIVIKYDPKMLQVVNNVIYPGMADDNFNALYKIFNYYHDGLVDNRSGLLKIKASGSFQGEAGNVATFFVNGIAKGTTKVEILAGENYIDGSKIWDEKEQNNILSGTQGGEIEIN